MANGNSDILYLNTIVFKAQSLWSRVQIKLIKCRFLRRGENRSTQGKNLSEQRREPTNSTHILTPTVEIEPGPHWWEASTLTSTVVH